MKKLSLTVVLLALVATATSALARVGCSDNTCRNWSDGALFDAYYQWDWSDLWWIFK